MTDDVYVFVMMGNWALDDLGIRILMTDMIYEEGFVLHPHKPCLISFVSLHISSTSCVPYRYTI
jgi:hypothetical protein